MSSQLLLGPAARRAIIVRTFLEPDREFYLRELVRLTGFAPRTVQEEIERLVAADLIVERRHGNRRYLSANKRHQLFRPVREIVIKTDGLVSVLRDALGDDGVESAWVFGSMASDAHNADSDIDLLVVGKMSLRTAVRRLTAAADVLGREINPVVWKPAEFKRRRAGADPFLANVLDGPTLTITGGTIETTE